MRILKQLDKPVVKPRLDKLKKKNRELLEGRRMKIMDIMTADPRYREYVVGVGIRLPQGDGINVYLRPGKILPEDLKFRVKGNVFYLPSRNDGSFRD